MHWYQQSRACRAYLILTYCLSLPVAAYAFYSFTHVNDFGPRWIFLTIASVFVATVNVRLPKISSVISMGDVFIILCLFSFGPGPALVTYWIDIIAAHLSDVLRKLGRRTRGKVLLHRLLFNLSCCALCVGAMELALGVAGYQRGSPDSGLPLAALAAVAVSWFFVNTVTVSLAISFWMNAGFLAVWQEGLHLYLLNFIGSAAAAGLIMSFGRIDTAILVLAVPLVVVLFQLYKFYISKYEQARENIAHLNKLYLDTVEALATAVDAKDQYTHGHIRRVEAYATALGSFFGMNEEKHLMGLRAGALLHDIGKIAIPEYILNKPASLTDVEYERMKSHPAIGSVMLRSIDFPYPVVPIVRSHHERWDGYGYPDGLKGTQIPLGARILSLVDCYDALTTHRPYRSPMARADVISFFQKEAGKAFDPDVVNALIAHLPELEEAGRRIANPREGVWGASEQVSQTPIRSRQLESIEPLAAYNRAATQDAVTQRNLRSVVAFARTDMSSLCHKDVLFIMGSRLAELVSFDAAVFLIADPEKGMVTARHVVGESGGLLEDFALSLDHKLSGWAAANRQSFRNLSSRADFAQRPDLAAVFKMCAISSMNIDSRVIGAISLYRKQDRKFDDGEFHRLELVASQTAIALSKCRSSLDEMAGLFDAATSLPNGDQLHLIFNQAAKDARQWDYTLALCVVKINRRDSMEDWTKADENDVAGIAQGLASALKPTDLLVRYNRNTLIAVVSHIDRAAAHALRERMQQALRLLRFKDALDEGRTTLGIAMFPEDAAGLESLINVAEWDVCRREDHTPHAKVVQDDADRASLRTV